MLTKTTKLPCYSYSLPAKECKVGGKLRDIKNSTCSTCYALKGMFTLPAVQKAHYRNLEAINSDTWVSEMVILITKKEKSGFFRWHTSGDIQNLQHLEKIIAICNATPTIRHWLPTRERAIINSYTGIIPDNLTIRLSSTMIDVLQDSNKFTTSTVHKNHAAFGQDCLAPKQNGSCLDCRSCWNKEIKNISYLQH
jgi:hypothetical protein